MSNKIYPIGIQNFESLRRDGYVYVDKTALVYQLAKTGRYYFLSRPRRFGKSLLISTLEAYFEGKKDLFEGLAIAKLEKEWKAYPVIHLDLNAKVFDTAEDLERLIDRQLLLYEAVYGSSDRDKAIEDRFYTLIRLMSEKSGQHVVILVDEYDKPLLQTMDNSDLQEVYRNMLKAFYGVMKSQDRYIKFALLTGVTKFSKVSVFSDLNNLTDITRDFRYAEICGITEKEIHDNFEEELHELATQNRMTYAEVCAKLKEDYDGYHFTEESVGIYNPFSLLNTFAKMRFGSYWFETGTPTYLVTLLRKHRYDLEQVAEAEGVNSDMLDSVDAHEVTPIPVLYQSGYLTIKGYDALFDSYRLGFPNKEVEQGFLKFILPFYASTNTYTSSFNVEHFIREVRAGKPEAFLTRLRAFFADTPYELAGGDLEVHYQNILFILFRLTGFYAQVEYRTSNGRVDLVVQTDHYIYIMEFKLHSTAEEAMRQIEEKQYALPFSADPRKLFKIGVSFDEKTRNVGEWVIG
ncbi:MAG: ATP-binding protein [Mediterranea sp.]|jgi:hypothetical protein|nr:ATP-binding protein [Mediterranea sp.]